MRKGILLLLMLSLAGPVLAQESRGFRALGVGEWVLSGVDVAQTTSALSQSRFEEANPIMKPLATHPVAFGAAKMGAAWGLNTWTSHIYKTKPKTAWAARIIIVGVQGFVVGWNAYQLSKGKR